MSLALDALVHSKRFQAALCLSDEFNRATGFTELLPLTSDCVHLLNTGLGMITSLLLL